LQYNDSAVSLQQYYKVGYGYPINYKISCPLISDMFHHIDDMVSGYRYVHNECCRQFTWFTLMHCYCCLSKVGTEM